MPQSFDRNQIKEYLGRVEDDCAEFIGAEFCAARLIGYISGQREAGSLSDERAQELLADAHHLMHLVLLGHKYTRQARNPAPEVRIMVLADEQRERRFA